MESILGLIGGFNTILEPTVLFYCFIGVFLGTLVGVIPGIGALAAVSLLLPLTYHLNPTVAIITIAGIYYGTQYGGSTASILLNLPGSPSNVITCIDGYPMSKQGRSGVALCMTAIASFVGSMIGVAILLLFSLEIANLGLKFGPAEYFSLMMLGLVMAAAMTSGSILKGFAMVTLGLIIGTIGIDIHSGIPRFHFEIPSLMDGIGLVTLVMGLFGLVEILMSDKFQCREKNNSITFKSMTPTKDDIKRSVYPILRGTAVGSFFGTLPGIGPTIASFSAYSVEKKFSKNSDKLGTGAIEGLVSPEAANNAAVQTAWIPTLMLGIPGDAVMSLMIAVLIIHGIYPGPTMIAQQPEIFWGLIASFIIGNILLLILNIPFIKIWVRLLQIPYHYLYPLILIFISVGVYSVSNNIFDIYIVALIGIVGYFLYADNYQFPPLLLGFVLGPLIEEKLRRSLLISGGDFKIFFESPISAALLATTALIIIFAVIKFIKSGDRRS